MSEPENKKETLKVKKETLGHNPWKRDPWKLDDLRAVRDLMQKKNQGRKR